MESKTHWKKLTNPDYLGAYSFEQGKDMILTIESYRNEAVTGEKGKSEMCSIMHFKENQKPLIVNKTNAKMLEKIYGTPFIEEWVGRKVQLYSDPSVKFGKETVGGVRVRPYIPKQTSATLTCVDCNKKIEPAYGKTAEELSEYTYSKYGKALCSDCAKKLSEASKGKDVLE